MKSNHITRNSLGNQSQRTKIYSESEILAEIDEAKRKQPQSTGSKPVVPQPSLPIIPSQGAVQPVTFEKAFFLAGEFGKKVDAKVHEMFPNIPAIDAISYNANKGVVVGSNPFYGIATNMVLQQLFHGIRTANQGELEFIAQNDAKHPLKLKGNHYEDSALVWRSDSDPNKYLATNVLNELRKANMVLGSGMPVIIPLYCMKLAKDNTSPYKLSFEITLSAPIFKAPILNRKSQLKFENSDVDAQTGLPTEVRESGSRTMYTRNYDSYDIKDSGLSRLYLSRYLSVGSNYGELAGSVDYGRVVVVSSEATAKKLGL